MLTRATFYLWWRRKRLFHYELPFPHVPESSKKQPPYTLRNVLEEQIRDLYDAINEYSNFLSEMRASVSNPDLIEILGAIAKDNVQIVADLEEAARLLKVEPTGVRCEAMAGLLREGKETTQEYQSGAVRDAALIANAQRIAHYEIAGFGTTKEFAKQMDLSEIVSLLDDSLDRALSNDRALTKLATGSWLRAGINAQAVEKM